VDTVVEIYIRVAGRSENHASAGRKAGGGVGGKVALAEIGLGLDDVAGGFAVDQQLAQEVLRDNHRVSPVE
jgi:hypothetical protein